MNFRNSLKRTVFSFDDLVGSIHRAVIGEENALLSFVFHGLFQGQDELEAAVVDPQQAITVEMFRRFVGHFKRHSYNFVSPEDILEGLRPGHRYLLITFDDGYFNNIRALPVLQEFNVPAVFFVSSDYVKYGKAYWWDVVFREYRKQRRTHEDICRTVASYKRLRTDEVESLLITEFGKCSLKPVGDLDRPFRTSELVEISNNPLVFLGNHTKDHAILMNYSVAEIREQIQGGQDAIRELTGKYPQIIAYPNGSCSEEIIRIASDIGLRLGMGILPGKNRLPLEGGTRQAMNMRRAFLWGDCGIEQQCQAHRSDVSLYRILKNDRSTS